MKLLKTITAFSLLISTFSFADGFGFNLGPFSLFFNLGDPVEHTAILNNPICFAIKNRHLLEIFVEGSEKISTKEIKIISKILVVEPHAFGVTKEGKPILRGNVIKEKLVKEVSVKYGEEQFNEYSIASDKDKGYFSGWFKSDKAQNIDIRKVSDIRVIEGSHFDTPKDYKHSTDSDMRIICELSSI